MRQNLNLAHMAIWSKPRDGNLGMWKFKFLFLHFDAFEIPYDNRRVSFV